MQHPSDLFYLKQDEPLQSCLLALHTIILQSNEHVTAEWKYGMPFFCYKGNMFCYLWIDKKLQQPYIGFVEGKHLDHPALSTGKRSRMKTIHLDAEADLPIETISELLSRAILLYQNGTIKIKR